MSADPRTASPAVPAPAWDRLDPAEAPADGVEVGRVADAWGVKGWIKVHPHSSAPEALFSCRRWVLLPAGAPEGGAGYLLRIVEAREHGAAVVARAEGIDDRDLALALRGARVVVPRSSFPTPVADEFYWVDLIGLEVVNREGVALGAVAELMANGPQTVMVLRNEEGGTHRERLIPFVKAFVDEVDLAARRIRVDWQPDY